MNHVAAMNHVALVIPGMDRLAGAELQVLQLARGLHRRQWRVTVIAMSGSGGDAGAGLIADGLGFLTLGMRKGLADPAGWIKLHRWIQRQKPDVLHAHLPHAAWMVRWSRLFAPVRVVCDTVHSSRGTIGRQLGYRFSNWLTDAESAVSEGAANACLSVRMVSADRLVVIPNGVDTGRWKPLPPKAWAAGKDVRFKDKFLWLAAGRLEPVKNYPALLDAFAELPETAHLIIAGTGPMEAELRGQCADLDVESRVDFLGFERNLLSWMQKADALVLSSLWEGLPMVLLEAGACGLPAVATDVAGSREVLVHGETGLLARTGSATDLAAAMMTMMRMDPKDRRDLGLRARERVGTRFSLETVLDRWDAFYRELLHDRPLRSRVRRGTERRINSTIAASSDAA